MLAVPLLFLALLTAHMPVADAATDALLYEHATSTCIVSENNTIYLSGGCPSTVGQANHAAVWVEVPVSGVSGYVELQNEHYGDCITVSSTGTEAFGSTCTGNSVQLWRFQEVSTANGNAWHIVNHHTGLNLGWLSGNGTVMQDFCNCLDDNWDT